MDFKVPIHLDTKFNITLLFYNLFVTVSGFYLVKMCYFYNPCENSHEIYLPLHLDTKFNTTLLFYNLWSSV